jgi:adenylate cyclase
MQLLRDFHGRMEEQVFRHGGTLEKFIGDAMLAIFGAPVQGEHDAADALACMRDMLASLAAWNGERRAAGEPEIRIGVGVHYGPAVFGDIGSQRNMAFAVIGDTVNTASRLQALTRELDCQAVVSAAAVGAAGGEPGDLQPAPAQQLRGRRDAIAVWTLKD